MPTKKSRLLTVTFDVSHYTAAQVEALKRAIPRHLSDREEALDDGHPGVENITFREITKGGA